MTSLGDVATFVRGVTFKPSDICDPSAEGSIAVLRTKNVQRQLDLSDVIRIPARLVKRSDQILREGDTLISSANSWHLVGKCCWVPRLDEPAAVGGFITALRPVPGRVVARYLYHWFSSPTVQATVRSFGNQTTSISNLNLQRCATLDIPLPSLAEQKRIVAILDQADALRSKRRQALAHLGELTNSIFHDMFGNLSAASSTIGEVAQIQGGLQVSTKRESAPVEVPYLRVANVYRGRLDLTEVKRLKATDQEISRTLLSKGDLLFVEGHANPQEVGRVAVWGGEVDRCVHQNHLIRGRLDVTRVLPEFAAAWPQ